MIALAGKIFAALGMLVAAIWYSIQTYRQKITPTITTWIVFGAASGLSLWTYWSTSPDEVSINILNFADPVAVLIMIGAILLWSDYKTHLDQTHKWYAAGVFASFVVWVVSDNPFVSNIMVQIIMFIGYLPTIQTLVDQEVNTESYVMWGAVMVAAVAASLPALTAGDTLTFIYVGRTVAMAGIILGLMARHDLQAG